MLYLPITMYWWKATVFKTHNLNWPISDFLEGWCWCSNINCNCKSAELIVSINSKKHLVDSLKQSKYIKQSQFGSEASGHTLDTMHRLAVVSPFNIWFIVQQKQMEVKLFTVSMNMVSCYVQCNNHQTVKIVRDILCPCCRKLGPCISIREMMKYCGNDLSMGQTEGNRLRPFETVRKVFLEDG